MNIFVCCSSSNNIDKKYFEEVEKLGEALAINNWDLVFGACLNGSMGTIYRTMKKRNRKTIAITSAAYKEELLKLECDVSLVTARASEAEDKLLEYSDAIIFTAGSIGTLYELFSTIERKRTGEFDKAVVILNSTGFFDLLLDMLNGLYNDGFTDRKVENNYYVTDSIVDCIHYIKNYKNNMD